MISNREVCFELIFVILFLSFITWVCIVGQVSWGTSAFTLIFASSTYLLMVFNRSDMREKDRKLNS